MKLEFKFSIINIVTFLILGGLCYWLIPLPAAVFWRVLIRTVIAVVLFGMCFVVVSRGSFLRKK